MQNKNRLLIILLIGILLPTFCLGQTAGPPQSLEGLKQAGLKALKFFPELISKVAGETFNWLKNIWSSYIYPFLHGIWKNISPIFGQEVERRKPLIQQEFKQEGQELKQEVPSLTTSAKSFWEKIKNFFGKN